MAREWNNRNTVWKNDKDKKFTKNYRKPIDYKVMPVKVSGLKVWIQNGDVDKALRKFKKKIANSGKLQELKAREHYEKPSIARKRAKDIARKRHLKEVAENSIHRKRKYEPCRVKIKKGALMPPFLLFGLANLELNFDRFRFQCFRYFLFEMNL